MTIQRPEDPQETQRWEERKRSHGGFLREIQDNMDRIRAAGSGPINPPIFYGAMINLPRLPRSTSGIGGKTDRFDRWFNAITGCALNIALLGYILVAYSAWSGR